MKVGRHQVDRIDLGVAADNAAAQACYRTQGFRQVGLWPKAIIAGEQVIDVSWMTLSRTEWERGVH